MRNYYIFLHRKMQWVEWHCFTFHKLLWCLAQYRQSNSHLYLIIVTLHIMQLLESLLYLHKFENKERLTIKQLCYAVTEKFDKTICINKDGKGSTITLGLFYCKWISTVTGFADPEWRKLLEPRPVVYIYNFISNP